PQASDGPPSNACVPIPGKPGWVLTLLRVGFAEPSRSPGTLVVSYTTVSPLPHGRSVAPVHAAVCFLWHFPANRSGLPLATTLPCGVRTFLETRRPAAARPTRPRCSSYWPRR